MDLALKAVPFVLAVGMLQAAEYSVTSGAFTVPADATKVVKTGADTVTLNVNSSAANVTYEVKAGTLTVQNETTRLGTGTPKVYVDEGATLWCSNLVVKSSVTMELHLNGTVKYSPNGSYGKASKTYLGTDVAKAIVEGNRSGMWAANHLLDMGGHTFNIDGYGWRKNSYAGDVTGYTLIGSIKDNGDFNLGSNAELVYFCDNVSYTGTTAVKTITLGDKAEVVLCAKTSSSLGQTTTAKNPIPYGVVADGDAYVTSESNGGTAIANFKGANTWRGPMKINPGKMLTAYTRYSENMLFAAGVDGPGTLAKAGTATLFMTGKVDCAVNNMSISRGTVTLENGTTLAATNENSGVRYEVSNEQYFNALSRLWVGDGGCYTSATKILSLAWAANTYGLVDVASNGTVSSFMTLGGSGGGYLRVLGGSVNWLGTAKSTQNMAQNAGAYSALVITNGTVRFSKDCGLTCGVGDATICVGKGGGFYPDYSCHFGKGYDVFQLDGIFFDKYSIYAGANLANTYGDQGGLVFTMDGENADFFANAFWLATPATFTTARYTAQVNLNRGTFRPNNFSRQQQVGTRNDRLYLTANGGTFKHAREGEYYGNLTDGGSMTYGAPDKIVVYPGGLTIDTDVAANKKVRIATPIEAPTGKGVKSVTLPASILSLENYPGPAKLKISTTRGAGFTAICDYEVISDPNDNARYGRQKGVKVTCPGWDLQDASDVTVSVYKPLYTAEPVAATVELEDNVATGGIIKKGAGYLVIASNANTYGGETYVQEGTLEVESGASLPSNACLRTAHNVAVAFRGAQELKSLSVEGFLFAAGPGKYTITDSLVVDGSVLAQHPDRNIQRATEFTFSAGAKVVVKNPEAITERRTLIRNEGTQTGLTVPSGRLPVVDEAGQPIPRLRAMVRNGTLCLGPEKGLVLIIR